MPLTAINMGLPSTQELTAMLVLYFVWKTPGLTEDDLLRRIAALGGNTPRPLWRPSHGTLSTVVRDLLAARQLKARWANRRKRPLWITPQGVVRLRNIQQNLKPALEEGVAFLSETLREIYHAPHKGAS